MEHPPPRDSLSCHPGQPIPIECQVDTQGGITAIARLWAPGDVERCRLCTACTARGNLCLKQTTITVTDEDAWLFPDRGPPACAVPRGGRLRLTAG